MKCKKFSKRWMPVYSHNLSQTNLTNENSASIQHDLWSRLATISRLSFSAKSGRKEIGWNGEGNGSVKTKTICETELHFFESGSWQTANNKVLKFSNTYRWRLDKNSSVIELAHLRYGESQPVPLLTLLQTGARQWSAQSPHMCNADQYSLTARLLESALQMNWAIQGPKKDESLIYVYS